MKKTLNEELSRIKGVMKMVNENEFESQPQGSHEQGITGDKIVMAALDDMNWDFNMKRSVTGYRAEIRHEFRLYKELYILEFTFYFGKDVNSEGYESYKGCDIEFVEAPPNMKDELMDFNYYPSEEVQNKIDEIVRQYFRESGNNEPDSMKSLGMSHKDFM